jgi:hypothetical protein
MGKNRPKLSVYVTEQQRRQIKSVSAYLGISINHFVHLAIQDRIKKEQQKEAQCQKG